MNMKTIEFGLVNGRHDLPVYRYIINEVSSEQLFDFNLLEERALTSLMMAVNEGADTIRVYVTGLTSMTIATINAMTTINKGRTNPITLLMAHYDRCSGLYRDQVVRV